MKKWLYLILLFCSLKAYSFYSHENDSSALIKQLIILKDLSHSNYDSTIKLSAWVKDEAVRLNLTKVEWEALLFMGDAYGEISQIDSAFSILNRVLEQAITKGNRIYEIKARTELAALYREKSQFDLSIIHYVAAEKLLQSSDDFDLFYNIMLGMAITHRKMKDFDRSKSILHAIIDDYYYQLDTIQKFTVYNSLGTVSGMTKEYIDAESYFQKAFNTIKEVDNPERKARITYNLGAIYVRLKKYEEAEEYIQKALTEYEKMNDKSGIEFSYRALAAMQIDLKNYEEAEKLSFQALKISREIEDRRKVLGNYRNLYLIYGYLNEGTTDFKMLGKELEYFRKWAFLKDSIYQTEMTDKIFELEKQYETEKKNNQIELLAKDNQIKEDELKVQQIQRNSLLIFVLLVLGVLGVFIYAFNHNRKMNRLLQAQSKRIVAQNEQIFNQNKKLQKAIETRDKLFSIIAHDLRSPLTSIANFSRLINFYLKDNQLDSLKEVAEDLEKKNTYVLELTDNLLTWARSQSENLEPQLEKVSVKEIVEECLDIYASVSHEKKVELAFAEQEDALALADHNMVKTIVRNLINNAIKFTPENGMVSISYQQDDRQVEICVADTGIGMPMEQAKLLFNSDHRKIRKGTKGEKSTGLGLSVCQEFANALNGKIHAVCSENEGCRFFVSIPIFVENQKHNGNSTKQVSEFSDAMS